MTILHVTMYGKPLEITVDQGLLVDVEEGKILVCRRPSSWTVPPAREVIRPRRSEFPVLVIDRAGDAA